MSNYPFDIDFLTFFRLFQGFDPLARAKFVPKYKKKGRSSAGSVERRKKQVAHEDQRVSNPESKMKFDEITLFFVFFPLCLHCLAHLS